MPSETELWSLDPGGARSICMTLTLGDKSGFSKLDLRRADGKAVKFPIELTDIDLQNLIDAVVDHVQKNNIRIRLPKIRITRR